MVRTLFTEEEIARRVGELSVEIARAIPGDLTVVGILKGSFVFVADLVRALDRAGRQPKVEFIRLSSYGRGKKSSGHVQLVGGDLPEIDRGSAVLVVDDIVDTGRSLSFAKRLFEERGLEVSLCVLIDKPSRREVEVSPEYVGFEIDDLFVVGYGIDHAEKYRHLPYIGTVD